MSPLQYLTMFLIYFAVIARAIGWSYDFEPFSITIWILLAVFGIFLFTEKRISSRYQWYQRYYILIQSILAISLLYSAPKVDFFSMLLLPLSFQVVKFYKRKMGFIIIGLFTLSMAGMFLFGLEFESGLTMILSATGVNLLMGNLEYLIDKTDQAKKSNQQMFAELKDKYRQMKNSASQAEALAIAEERHHLVRDMHDSLTQTLFSMNLAMQSAQLVVTEKPQSVNEYITRLLNLSRNAINEVHVLTGTSSNFQDSSLGLVSELKKLAEQRLEQDDITIQFEIYGKREFSKVIQSNIYSIIQESLNNIARHAGVQSATIRLNLEEPKAWIEVIDLGKGFDIEKVQKKKGFGLNGMSERAQEINWELQIESAPERGTCIRITERII